MPVIKLHEGGRHTARSLGDDAGIDSDISQRTLGHATRAKSYHYNHPEAARFRLPSRSPLWLIGGPDHERVFPRSSLQDRI